MYTKKNTIIMEYAATSTQKKNEELFWFRFDYTFQLSRSI